MLTLSLSPVFGWFGAILAAVAASVVGWMVHHTPVSEPHDWEREYKRIEMKVRHPWKARASRFLGID